MVLDKWESLTYILSTRLEDRLQHPHRYVVPITFELTSDSRLESIDVRTWIIIAALASDGSAANDGREFISPGHETMARLCNCTINTIRSAYKRLEAAGWIKFLPSDNGYPIRIQVNVPRPEVVYHDHPMEARVSESPATLHKMYSPAPTNLSESSPPPQVLPQTAPQFPSDLVHLADSICLRDLQGAPSPLPSVLSLWAESHHANIADMRKGLHVMQRYMNNGQRVTAPTGLWRSLFNNEGRFIVKKRMVASRSMANSKEIPEFSIKERLATARDLARGITIEIGKLHPKLRAALLERDAVTIMDSVHCTLKPTFDLTFNLAEYKFDISVITPEGDEEYAPAPEEATK
jgi:hypothetical protein